MAASLGAVNQRLFLVLIFAYAILVFAGMVWSFQRGSWLGAVVATWMASTIPTTVLGMVVEGRSLGEIFDPVKGSWSFIIGDSLFLAFANAMFALGVRAVGAVPVRWFTGYWAMAFALVLGLACGLAFHAHDAAVYATLRLNSPTKLYHDLAAFTILVASVVYGSLKVFTNRKGVDFGALAWVGVLGWAGLAIADNSIHKLNPANLHPEYKNWV